MKTIEKSASKNKAAKPKKATEGKPVEKDATLGDVDSTFTDNSHGRTSGRLADHEPGSGITPPEHGAYNL